MNTGARQRQTIDEDGARARLRTEGAGTRAGAATGTTMGASVIEDECLAGVPGALPRTGSETVNVAGSHVRRTSRRGPSGARGPSARYHQSAIALGTRLAYTLFHVAVKSVCGTSTVEYATHPAHRPNRGDERRIRPKSTSARAQPERAHTSEHTPLRADIPSYMLMRQL
ncbi:hypothetical protein EVAR_29553_1 [Eumeta japonica]|uniref:Uncharacterized protein n=1 Tax=Eumeta variegata TaxID=151549 RepID=A0A4C1WGH2_EUMVA|nr:hypothetical protein EVAR_29553_1 [Eumeta japonica]